MKSFIVVVAVALALATVAMPASAGHKSSNAGWSAKPFDGKAFWEDQARRAGS